MSLTVVYATDTGHVLAALSPTGPAGDMPPLGDLIGDALPLWASPKGGRPVPVPFPASRLAAAVVADQPFALDVPMAFGVELIGRKPRPELATLKPVPAGGVPLAPPSQGGLGLNAGTAGVQITLPAPADADLPVLMLVGDADGARPPQTGEIHRGETSVTFTMTLDPGDFAVLALVAGWRGVLLAGTNQ